MKKAKTKSATNSKPPVPNPGFYGAGVRSPQAVEFGKGSNMAYLKPGQERAEIVSAMRRTPNTSDVKLKMYAEYQGEGTFSFKRRKTDVTPQSNDKI